jgi:hypothetical protein
MSWRMRDKPNLGEIIDLIENHIIHYKNQLITLFMLIEWSLDLHNLVWLKNYIFFSICVHVQFYTSGFNILHVHKKNILEMFFTWTIEIICTKN